MKEMRGRSTTAREFKEIERYINKGKQRGNVRGEPKTSTFNILLPFCRRSLLAWTSSHRRRSCSTQTLSRDALLRSVSRRPNRTCAVVVDGDSVTFPTVGPENLVRLVEESLQIYSTLLRLNPSYGGVVEDREYMWSISGLVSRNATSPTRLSSAGVAASTETSYQVLLPRYIFLFSVTKAPGG
jgi:hypothetical protein